MPGSVAFINPIEPTTGATLLEKMGRALEPEARFKLDVYTENDLGLGRASLGIVNAQPQPLWNQAGDICIVMEGELYDTQA
jgi:asparagine synthetase B (glutamine-hydrolysing)